MDPITIGLILTAAGAVGNNQVQSQRAKSLNRNTQTVLTNAKRKQSQLDQERRSTLGQALEDAAVGRGEVEAAQGVASDKSVARMEANSRPAPTMNAPDKAGVNGPAGRVIASAADREAGANAESTAGRRRAAADMDSLGDVLNNNSRVFRPAYAEIQGNQRIAQGESDRMQLELQAAQEKAMKKGRTLEMASGLASGVGSGLLAGGAGAWATAPAAAGVSGGTGTAVTSATSGMGMGAGTKFGAMPYPIY